ncbi:WD repeat-containing protein 48-like protein [Bienertia sinuspersici]
MILKERYELLYWKDSNGDTPLHLAAGLPPEKAVTFFEFCFDQWNSDIYHPPPWTATNSKGNTYLHIYHYEVIFSESLLRFDVKDLKNDNGDTILHEIAKYATNAAEQLEQLLKLLPTLSKGEEAESNDELECNFVEIVACNYAETRHDEWIIHSGATHHMSGNLDMVKKTKSEGGNMKISLPNGGITAV